MPYVLRSSLLLAGLIACPAVCLAEDRPTVPPVSMRPTDSRAAQDPASELEVTVREFRFTGNRVFSDAELARVVKEYTNRPLTSEMLEESRLKVTRYYVEKGYINSGAMLPDQDVKDGVVTMRVIEGRLNDINLSKSGGTNARGEPIPGRLNDRYVTSRIRRGASGTLNIARLNDQLELLRLDPNVRRINAELRPGLSPGESYLDVLVVEANPYQLGLRYSNSRPPSVGAEQLDLLASHHNLTGNGDLLALRYGVTQGGFNHTEFAGADDFGIDYIVPITPEDTSLAVNFTRSNAPVVEETFQDLHISSESDNVALTLRQPLYRRTRDLRSTEVAAFVTAAYRDNETFLLGKPFSFSPGAVNGRSAVTAFRFGQEFTTSGQSDALSLRSTFSVGTTWFGATRHGDDDVADGQFGSWLGQAQYVRRVGATDSRAVFRVSGQLATDPLLSIEQFSIGGVDTVRGYRENQLVRDMGVVASVELYVPVWRGRAGASVLELVPFTDVGYGRNETGEPPSETLSSVGVGMVFTPDGESVRKLVRYPLNISAQLYYGYALNPVDVGRHKDLQDRGIHFSVSVFAF